MLITGNLSLGNTPWINGANTGSQRQACHSSWIVCITFELRSLRQILDHAPIQINFQLILKFRVHD